MTTREKQLRETAENYFTDMELIEEFVIWMLYWEKA